MTRSRNCLKGQKNTYKCQPSLNAHRSLLNKPDFQVDNSASEVDPGELEDRTRENGVGRHHERLDASVGCNHSGENEHPDDNVD